MATIRKRYGRWRVQIRKRGYPQTTRTRRCQQAIRQQVPDFNPPGLDDFLRLDKEKTNLRAKQVIDRIERALQGVVLEELRSECKGDWWLLGVPKKVRLEVIARFEGDDGRRGSKEAYFDLIDYRRIALDRWDIFAGILAYGNSGNKEKRTKWLVTVNDKRNIVSHPSSAIALSLEELAELEHYEQWLANNIAGTVAQAEAQSASVEEEDTAET